MFRHLTRELARAARLGAEVSLLVLDLNGFKDINDTNGHHAGIAPCARSPRAARAGPPLRHLRRYAGDEFIVVLAGCGRDEAENKRASCSAGSTQIVFEPAPGTPVPMSISVGAAVFPHDGETYESLLAAADRRIPDPGQERAADATCSGSSTPPVWRPAPLPMHDASVA